MKVKAVYERLGKLASSSNGNPKLAQRELEDVGNELWEDLIPDDFKRKYWELPSACLPKKFINNN